MTDRHDAIVDSDKGKGGNELATLWNDRGILTANSFDVNPQGKRSIG